VKEYLFIAADYLKGNSIYPPVRRMLNLIFNISIASAIYVKCYGSLNLMIKDYQDLMPFFIKGYFFIPFSIYVAVWGITSTISINNIKTTSWQRQIISLEYQKGAIDKLLEETENIPKAYTTVDLSKDMIVQLYSQIRHEITPEIIDSIEKDLIEPKNNLEATFHLAFRALIAITIYFASICQFGWILYLSVLVTITFGMYLMLLAYNILDVIPVVTRKIHSVAEEYIVSIAPTNTTDNTNPANP
jgi:hypothetical protein